MELTNSLDWQNIKDEIKRMSRMLPAFSHDFYRITINLDNLVKELGNLEVECRSRKNLSSKDAHNKKVKQINDELKLIRKIHLMSVLSR
jgi:hypothetical protein